jgi:hypothetical protein
MSAAVASSTSKPKRKVRRIGLEGPYSSEQITTWVCQPVFTTIFYVTAVLMVKDPINQAGVLGGYTAAVLIGFTSWLCISLIDPSVDGDKACACPCMKITQAQSRYCQVCRKTTVGLDHHCTWLNTCVGKKNYPHFFLVVLSFAVAYCLQFVMSILLITSWQEEGQSVGVFAAMIVLIVCLVPFITGFMLLLFFHIYLMFRGIGTYDFLADRKERQMKASEPKVDPEEERRKKERIEKKQGKWCYYTGDRGM